MLVRLCPSFSWMRSGMLGCSPVVSSMIAGVAIRFEIVGA